jgi:hypothetical protein
MSTLSSDNSNVETSVIGSAHQENPLGYIVSYRQMPKYR